MNLAKMSSSTFQWMRWQWIVRIKAWLSNGERFHNTECPSVHKQNKPDRTSSEFA